MDFSELHTGEIRRLAGYLPTLMKMGSTKAMVQISLSLKETPP